MNNTFPATTFLLISSRTTPAPTITDNNSPAAITFNATLRAICQLPSFHSVFFGRPTQSAVPESGTVAGWFTDVPFNVVAIFINWKTTDAAEDFVKPENLEKSFSELRKWYNIPSAASTAPEIKPPTALHLSWLSGSPYEILTRLNVPMEVNYFQQQPESRETGAVAILSRKGEGSYLQIKAADDGASAAASEAEGNHKLVLTLMRAKFCSTVRNELEDLLKARRVD